MQVHMNVITPPHPTPPPKIAKTHVRFPSRQHFYQDRYTLSKHINQGGPESQRPPASLRRFFLALYTVELLMRFAVGRWPLFRSGCWDDFMGGPQIKGFSKKGGPNTTHQIGLILLLKSCFLDGFAGPEV